MTTEELSKGIMEACRTSGLPLLDQATALGTAYACYLLTKGITPAELHYFIDQATIVVDEVAQKVIAARPESKKKQSWNVTGVM